MYKIIFGLYLLAAAISPSIQYNGVLESLTKQNYGTSSAGVPSPLTGSTPAVNIVHSVVIVLPPAPDAGINQVSQYNNELSSIVRLLQLLRVPPAGLPSLATDKHTLTVSSPPSVPSMPKVSPPPSVSTPNDNPTSRNTTLVPFEGVACSRNDVAGVCMELKKCTSALQDIKNGKLLQFCGFTGSEPVVCCVLLSMTSTTTTSSATTSTTTLTTPESVLTTTKSNKDITDEEEVSEPATIEPEREGCGWSYPRAGVNNGTSEGEVQYGEFPWTCAVLRSESVTDGRTGEVTTRDVFNCPGALIHPAVVLIRYHTDGLDRVRAGVESGTSTAGGRRAQLRDVGSVERQGDWPYLTLLFLTAPMTLAPNVAVACLPPPSQWVPPGTTCVVTHWDHAIGDVYNYEAKLLKVQVATIERHICQGEMIETGHFMKGYKLSNRYSCVKLHGSERTINNNTCEDMSTQESPVSCTMESKGDRYMLTGLAWYAYNCNSDPLWTYLDLSRYRTWIDLKVTAKGYYTTSYSVGSH